MEFAPRRGRLGQSIRSQAVHSACMSVSDVQRRLLTLDEVAQRLGVSRRTVERHVAAGEIPALQLGGPRTAIRVDEQELDDWLCSERKEPA